MSNELNTDDGFTLGDLIYTERTKRGLTMEALAYKAKVSYSTIYKTETDKSTPDTKTLEKIAAALEVAPSWIMEQIELNRRVK